MGASQTSKKYHYAPDKTKAINRSAPQSVRQKRADEWADIEAAENRERKELDAQQYREYMDEQAEKAGWIEDQHTILTLSLVSFFNLAVFSFLTFLATFGAFSFISFCISSILTLYFVDALKLRGGSSLTPRGKGAKR